MIKVKQIIEAFKTPEGYIDVSTKDGEESLNVSEFFFDTVQGEGVNTGVPAAFLRVKDCTLNCTWCDTAEVWRQGQKYSFDDLFRYIIVSGLHDKLLHGQHLVITGGSPLRQQMKLVKFISAFYKQFNFLPYIEIENECVIPPNPSLAMYVQCWNNSPKLESSGNPLELRYKPKVIKQTGQLPNSWFKFVISADNFQKDWDEIERDFLTPGLIKKEQVILMPQGATREELNYNKEPVLELAISKGVRYTGRLHIEFWNKKTGI